MREVIIASANLRAAENVRGILQSGQLFVKNIYASGSEVLSYASIRPEAVVVCGTLGDMTAITLSDMLPQGFDIVLLLPSGKAQTAWRSNLITLNMPLDRVEFIKTVRVLAATENESYSRKKVRGDDEAEILSQAKTILMDRHHISEREAHRLLQRRSMETGIRLIDIARMVEEDLE